MQKLVKRISLVMVALMTVFTALSYVPAKAATVVPKVQFVGEQKTEFTAGDRVQFNLNASNYGGRVQYRVVLWNDSTKSYSDLWNTADKYYTNWMPYGNETLPLGWVINEPGTYRITVYAKRAGLANSKTALKGSNCDSFLAGPAFVVKPAAATPESIAPVADVTVNEGETAVLPTEVTLNLSDKTTKTAKVTWAAVDTTKVGTVAVEGTVEGTTLKAKVNVTVKEIALAVSGITPVNAKEIAVTFTKPVDPDTVIADADGNLAANVIKIDGVDQQIGNAATGSFDDANKVLTLTKSAGQWNKDQVYVVSVSGVKNSLAVAVPAYAQAVKMTESTVPSINTISSKTKNDTTKTVTITFSEPVTFYSIKINNKYAQVATADAGFGAAWTLTAVDDLSVGTNYAIEINGLKDLFGNLASNILTTSVTPVKDATKPTFTLTAKTEKTFDVVFNKTMSSTIPVDAATVKILNADGTYLTLPLASIPTRNTDKVSYRVTLAGVPFAAYENAKELTVTVKNCVDSLGNVMDAATAKVTLTRDAVKPVVVSAAQKPGTQNQINLTLSEAATLVTGGAFNAASAANLDAAIKITDANGNLVKPNGVTAITVSSGTALDSSYMTTLTLSAALPATGTYRVVVMQGALQDSATVVNTNDAQVVPFSFTKDASVVAPVYATIVAKVSATGAATTSLQAARKVTVTFDRADVVNGLDVATGTYLAGAANNPANYALDGAALPAGATVSFVDNDATNGNNDTAIIDLSAVTAANLPAAFANGGDVAVSVNNVKTISGATLSYTTLLVNVADATKPTIKSAYLTGSVAGYTLTVIFSEKMSVVNAANLTLTDAVPVTYTMTTNAAVIDSNDATRATISLTAANLAGLDLTTALKLTITAGTTADNATVPNTAATDATGVSVVNYAQ